MGVVLGGTDGSELVMSLVALGAVILKLKFFQERNLLATLLFITVLRLILFLFSLDRFRELLSRVKGISCNVPSSTSDIYSMTHGYNTGKNTLQQQNAILSGSFENSSQKTGNFKMATGSHQKVINLAINEYQTAENQ